jgi:hypothetical protein
MFEELNSYINRVMSEYGISLITYRELSFLDGVKELLKSTGVKGIFLGTRRTDPHGGDLDVFSPSSKGWPQFMRINCILDFTYCQVWRFIKSCSLDYCTLYDQGYTSIGKTTDSFPNGALSRREGGFRAAAALLDGSFERTARSKVPTVEVKRTAVLFIISEALGGVGECVSHFFSLFASSHFEIVEVKVIKPAAIPGAVLDVRKALDRFSLVLLVPHRAGSSSSPNTSLHNSVASLASKVTHLSPHHH